MNPTASGLFHVENRDTARFGDVLSMTRLQLQGSVRRLRADLSRQEELRRDAEAKLASTDTAPARDYLSALDMLGKVHLVRRRDNTIYGLLRAMRIEHVRGRTTPSIILAPVGPTVPARGAELTVLIGSTSYTFEEVPE